MNFYYKICVLFSLVFSASSCEKEFEKFPNNPNVAGELSSMPPEYLFRQILTTISRGADFAEEPFSDISRLNQFTTGLTFPLYGGSNQYNWSQSGSNYGWLRDIKKLKENAKRSVGEKNNPYLSVAKFLEVYTFIWLTQRVGDIPVSEAGLGLANTTPKFDKQEAIYTYALKTLDEVNSELAAIAADATSPKLSGDIYFNNSILAWRRTINAYTLRVLMSLSKRASDTPALQIKETFNKIVSDPNRYPLMRDITDNMNFVYVPIYNRYPSQFLRLYSLETTVSATFLDLLTKNKDPRTFIVAGPSPLALSETKKLDDFSGYIGTENGRSQSALFAESQGSKGKYSYVNYNRYLRGPDFIPEANILIGFSEMCFNIAEAANLGWTKVSAEKYYLDGINASLRFYGITDGRKLPISGGTGAALGDVTVNLTEFLKNISYKGDNEEGKKQILEQKYVAFWQNSGWEPFYQFRRTGIPKFSQGVGTNSQQRIPVRWTYPVKEMVNNSANTKLALDSQFAGKDDVFSQIWLTK